MSEIKTACQGTSRLIESATMTYDEYLNLHMQGEKELRAAYEAKCNEVAQLQKENNSLKLGHKAKESILQEAQKEVAKLRSFDTDNKGLKECNSILTAENEAQAKRIAELERKNGILREGIKKLEAEQKYRDHMNSVKF